jgi:pimeloyl-ACP methyl ester carboxylesterase
VPTVHVNGIDVTYDRSGSGPRLLFLGGSGSTLASNRPLIDVFASACDVVTHDQRGLGATSAPPGPYTMAQYAADAAALLDHLGWERCRVVGISFGGMVAQEFAVTLPERVERLALLCTSPGGVGGASYPLHELEGLDERERMARYLCILDTRFTAEWLATHESDRRLVEFMTRGRNTPKSDEQRRGEREQLEARRHHDVCDRLGAISCPTFVGAGRYDGIAPPGNARAIVERVAGAELHLYEGGHAFMAQDPAAFADTLQFLTTT